jgi:hypothetical protein
MTSTIKDRPALRSNVDCSLLLFLRAQKVVAVPYQLQIPESQEYYEGPQHRHARHDDKSVERGAVTRNGVDTILGHGS